MEIWLLTPALFFGIVVPVVARYRFLLIKNKELDSLLGLLAIGAWAYLCYFVAANYLISS